MSRRAADAGALVRVRKVQAALVVVLAMALLAVSLLVSSRSTERAGAAGVAPATLAPEPRGKLVKLLKDAELVPSMSTPTSRTYKRPDGSFVSRIFSRPPSYRDDKGVERLIDTTLKAAQNPTAAAAFTSEGPGWTTTFPKTLAAPVRVDRDGAWFAMQLQDAAGTGTADGTVMTYADALPGADVVYRASDGMISEDINITSAKAASTYTFDLTASKGVTAERAPGGGIALNRPDGSKLLQLSPPFAYPKGARGDRRAVDLDLHQVTGGWRVTLAVDPTWMRRAVEAHGGVTIDPTIAIQGAARDCPLSSDLPDTSYCGAALWVGYQGDHDHTSLIKWDVSSIPQDAIAVWADIGLYQDWYDENQDADKRLSLHRLRRDWTSNATWNTYDGTRRWTTAGGDFETDPAAVALVPEGHLGWTDWYANDLVQKWISKAVPNYGLAVRDYAPDNGIAAEKDFQQTTGSNAATAPELDITWVNRTGLLDAYTFESQDVTSKAKASVNVANGNLVFTTKGVTIPGLGGFDLEVDNYNNSLMDQADIGGFGARSTGSLGRDLRLREEQGGSVTFYRGDGVIEPFINPTTTGGTIHYDTPYDLPGVTLTKNATTGVATLDLPKGLPAWPGLHLTATFRADGMLTTLADQSGHQMTSIYYDDSWTGAPAWGGITDTHGDFYDGFRSYVGDDIFGELREPDEGPGRWLWEYGEEDPAVLEKFTARDGSIYTYTSDTSNRLTKVVAPGGVTTLITYDGTSSRVASIVRPATSTATTGPTTTFAYSGPTPPCDASTGDIGKVIVTRPDATVTTYCHDARDRVTYDDKPVTPVSGSTRVGLEKFWDYDQVDTSSGSQLLVNSDTGNVLWHDVPIVNPGRGLSTFVNLDYNSLERAPTLGAAFGIDPLANVPLTVRPQYNVAGRGISISASGPTRLNEPLGGVGLADVRDGLLGTISGLPTDLGNVITLTDADGTTHHFKRDAGDSEKWIAPPGIHLTLRRFATTGDAIADPFWAMTRADGVTYLFNKLGYLIRTEDRNGNRLTYTYEKSDLLTGASGTSASACTAGSMLGAVSGTPSASNGWGLQAQVKTTVTAVAGKLCALRVTKVTDAGNRDLTVAYKSRAGGDQTSLNTALTNALGGTSKTLEAVLTGAQGTLSGLGTMMAPAPVATITDHAARQYTFDYTNGNLTSFVEVANAGTLAPTGDRARRWAFDYFAADDAVGAHRLKTVTEVRDTDEGGNRSTGITYQTRPGTPPSGMTATLVPQTITDRRGKVSTYGFSAYGAATRQVTITDARGKTWKRDVDAYGRPTSILDPAGNATKLRWDAGSPRRNDLRKVAEGVTTTDPGAVQTMTYDPVSGRLLTQTDYPDGESSPDTARTTELKYTLSSGQPSLRPSSDPDDDFVADLVGVLKPRTLPGGAHVGTKYTVDTATGNVTQQQDADGTGTAKTVFCNGTDCPKGLAKQEIDEVGNVTTYGNFDPAGLPQTVVGPKGNDIASGFPVPAGHPGTAQASQHRSLYRYDAVGNLLSASDPRNADALTNPTAAVPAGRYTTKFTYDAFDRAITQVRPKKSSGDVYVTESFTYDRNGNLLTEANAGTGKLTTYAYSATDLPSTITKRAWSRTSTGYTSRDETTTFQYDDTDLLVARTDPRGRSSVPATITTLHLPYTTEYRRDDAGRVVAQVQHAPGATPDRRIHSLALDGRGNAIGEIDAKRNADPNGDGSTADARSAETAISTAANAVTSANYANLRFVRVFDHVNQLERSTERPAPADPNPAQKIDEYDYDADGNVVTHRRPRHFTDRPAGFSGEVADTYTYDHRDQLTQTVDPLGHRTVQQRRADGTVVSVTKPRGVTDGTGAQTTPYTYFTQNYTFDAAGDLLTRTVPYAPGQYGRTDAEFAAWKVSYTRNAVGDATTITDPRQKVIRNEFLDWGALATTDRPSWWQLDTNDGTSAPELTERTSPETDTGDPAAGHPSGREHGKFGQVDPEDAPSLLPRRGATAFFYDAEGRMTSVVDAASNRSRIDYDPSGRVVGVTQPFDISAGADRFSDPANTGGTGAFPAGQRQISIRNDFDLDGNLITRRQLGNAEWYTNNTYDGYDRLTVTEAPGSSDTIGGAATREPTTYAYDVNDNVLTKDLPRTPGVAGDYKEQSQFDSLDRLLVHTNAAGEAKGRAYDVADNVTAITPPRGFTATTADRPNWRTLRTFDAADRLTKSEGAVVTDNTAGSMRPTSTYTYYDDDTLKQSRDPGALRLVGGGDVTRVTDYEYDGRGHVDRKVLRPMDAGGQFLSGYRAYMWEYDPNGNLRRMVNPSGVDTVNGVVDGLPTKPKNLDNYASTSDFDGNIANATLGATLRQYGDGDGGDDGLATNIWQPRNGSTDKRILQRFDYDARGRVQISRTAYENGELENKIPKTSYDYFANGWIKAAADERETDTSNNVIENRDAVYDYDESGNQKLWRTSRYSASTPTVGGKVTREFWPNGTLKTRIGRKVQVSSGSDTDVTTTRTYSYYYNGNHSLTAIRDLDQANHDTVIVRDAAEREKSVNETWSTGKDSWFDYDAAGNVTSRKVDGHLTSTATGAMDDQTGSLRKYARFKYDRADREVTSATWEPTNVSPEPVADNCDFNANPGPPAGTRCVRTAYHPGGQRETRRMSNNTLVTTLYDEFGEASSRRRTPASGSLVQVDYGYDARGNRTTDERGTYEYNARDKLTKWTRGGQAARSGSITYTVAPSGSVTKTVDTYRAPGATGDTTTDFTFSGEKLKKTVITLPGASDSPLSSYYCYNDFGSVTSIQSDSACHAQNSNGGKESTETCSELPDRFDANTTFYCYDEFDRLLDTRGKGSDDHQVVTYDPLDRRDKKTLKPMTGSQVTRDLSYVGTAPELSRETTDDGGRNTFDYDATGERLNVLEKAPGATAIRTKIYAKDANGSVTALEDGTGGYTAGDRYVYDPFGELDTAGLTAGETPDSTRSADAQANPFRFQGFYYDAAIKTYDMQARDYRPDVGRFLQQDTYEAASADLNLVGDPLTQNRYAFAGGNPVNNVEFDGHRCSADARTDSPCGASGAPSEHKSQPHGRTKEQRAKYREGANATYNSPKYKKYIVEQKNAESERRSQPPMASGQRESKPHVLVRALGWANDKSGVDLRWNSDCSFTSTSCQHASAFNNDLGQAAHVLDKASNFAGAAGVLRKGAKSAVFPAAKEAARGAGRGTDEILGGLSRGRQPHVRTVRSDEELRSVYDELAIGGKPLDRRRRYPGKWITRPDGIEVGIRERSGSGGATIDIRKPGADLSITKVHIR
jgi:RHS repeat-associated protein